MHLKTFSEITAALESKLDLDSINESSNDCKVALIQNRRAKKRLLLTLEFADAKQEEFLMKILGLQYDQYSALKKGSVGLIDDGDTSKFVFAEHEDDIEDLINS